MVHEEDASGEHTRDKRDTQLAIVILWVEQSIPTFCSKGNDMNSTEPDGNW